jgi:hypothetical protein
MLGFFITLNLTLEDLGIGSLLKGAIWHAMLYKISKFFLVNVVFIQKDQVKIMSETSG